MLYEALVGTHPFWHAGMNRAELQDAVCNGTDFETKTAFTHLPKQWQLFVRRMLAKDRIKRPHDAAQAARLIRKLEAT